MTDMTKIYTVE